MRRKLSLKEILFIIAILFVFSITLLAIAKEFNILHRWQRIIWQRYTKMLFWTRVSLISNISVITVFILLAIIWVYKESILKKITYSFCCLLRVNRDGKDTN